MNSTYASRGLGYGQQPYGKQSMYPQQLAYGQPGMESPQELKSKLDQICQICSTRGRGQPDFLSSILGGKLGKSRKMGKKGGKKAKKMGGKTRKSKKSKKM